MLKIAVMVSGGGTNLQAIIDAIENPETHIPKQITVSGMLMEGETVR